MAKQRYTAEQVAKVLLETNGMPTIAAARLGCDYHTVMAYIERYESVRDAQKLARAKMGDAAELKLYNKAMGTKNNPDGDTTALLFLLKTQYKSRGYVERSEQVNYNVPPEMMARFDALAKQADVPASKLFEDMMNAIAAELDAGGAEGRQEDR